MSFNISKQSRDNTDLGQLVHLASFILSIVDCQVTVTPTKAALLESLS